jgi:AMP deaminase
LRGRYQLHSDPTLTGDLFLDNNNSQKSDGNNNNNNNQNTKKGDGSNNTGQGDFLHSAGSTHVLKKHNSVFFDGVNVLNGAFSSNHNNNNNNIAGLSRYQSLGNLSLATNVTSGVFGGLGEGGSESADPDSPNGMTIGAASFRFGGDEDGALERAFKINSKGSGSSFDPSQWTFNMYYGVVLIHTVGTAPSWPEYIPTFDMFMQDVAYLRQLVTENSALSEFCLQRLKLLEHKFGLHLALNISKECGEVKDRELNNRDFYTAHKVDNNVQTEACMNARVLFHFFTERARNGSGDVVFERNNKPVTLRQYLTELNVDVERLTVDELTNLLQNHQQLRALFLSPDNYMGGRYFAEITKHMLEQYKNDKFSFVENRLPIYGRSRSEWDVLASWCDRYGMVSPQNRWMARVSRGYRHLHRDGHVDNFGDYLDNIFIPLWEVSLNPAKFPRLHHFLTYVSGFDCEGNEQKVDKTMENIPPHEWHSPQNPPYNYYVYYLWANITALNVFRRQRGLNVFSFRPQSGESGSLDHLIGSFLAADGISHGVQLIHSPTLQYLFYITQFPVAMSPLSNTTVIPYLDHPFAHFFSRGLNVSLATDKPLFNHFTSEPLIEEYSLASKIWKLQNGDLSELARNSVRMSDFSSQWKKKALGPLCSLHSCLGNDYKLSRVSDFRVAYRYETYHAELDYLDEVVAMEDLRMWIHCAAAGQFGEDSSSDRWTRVNGKSEANKNLVITPSQQQQQQRKRMSQQNNKPQRGASKLAQLLMLGVEGDDNNNNNDGDTTTGGGVSSKSKEKSSLLDRAKSSRIPPQQLIVASESQLLPFPRAMLPLEIELELYQQRMGTKVYFPAAFGSQQSDGEAEEAISRAALTAQLKQQLADMDRDLQLKKLEVDRMSDTQFSLATDIKSVRTKIAALAATPTTSIDAGLGQQSSSAVVVSSGTPNNNNNNNTASSTTENK